MLRGALVGILLLTIAATALPWPVAETRIALVIGNSTYPSGPLGSPKNDAEAVAKKLSDLGFAVTKLTNLGGPALHKAIRNFGQQLEQPETVGLFYYSGYAMQVNNRNYMIPIDAEINDEADIEEAGVPMENVLRRMEQARSNLNVVILDACRDNPFEKRLKSAQAGLAPMPPPTSMLIAFAAAPGKVAEAASGGRLSPYTEALLEYIDTPGQDLIKMFQVVRNVIWQRTQGRQDPHVEFTPGLPDFFFKPLAAAISPPARPSAFESFKECDVCPRMITLPGGTFTMGRVNEALQQLTIEDLPHLGLDMVFVMEIGASMAPYIQNATKAVSAIARLITQDPETAESIRFGFVGYRDDVKKMPWLEFTAKNFTPDGLLEVGEFLKVMGTVNSMMAAFTAEGRGSGDYQEEMYAGLREVLSTKWSDSSLRFVVLIGAASSHEVGHDQNTTGLDALTLRQQLDTAKIYVLALHLRDERAAPDHALAQQQFTTLATNEGGGQPWYYSVKASDMTGYNHAVKDIGTALTQLMAELRRGDIKAVTAAAQAAPVERIYEDLASGRFAAPRAPRDAQPRIKEGPQRQVTIEPFAMSKTEVTFGEWDACVAAGWCNGYSPDDNGWGRGSQPVINVSWEDAKAYVGWLSKQTGKPYRLPTEAEWEYAARSGTTTPFSFGKQISAGQANFGDKMGKTTEVGAYPENPWGLYDMHGNVWEWVEDCWHESYQGAPQDGRAWVEASCTGRVVRGGSWLDLPRHLLSAYRTFLIPDSRGNSLGFRVARTLQPMRDSADHTSGTD